MRRLAAVLLCVGWIATLPVPLAVGTQDHSIGAVGCSNTAQAVTGYAGTGGQAFWPASEVEHTEGGLSRGSLDRWADPRSRFWTYLTTMSDRYPQTNKIWYQICLRASERGGAGPQPTAQELAWAEAVVGRIGATIPGATIYASALNAYEGIVCDLTGPSGPAAAAAIVDHLVDRGLVRRGPTMTPLTESTHSGDFCHANRTGRDAWGGDLQRFFGVATPPPATTTTTTSTTTTTVPPTTTTVAPTTTTDAPPVTNPPSGPPAGGTLPPTTTTSPPQTSTTTTVAPPAQTTTTTPPPTTTTPDPSTTTTAPPLKAPMPPGGGTVPTTSPPLGEEPPVGEEEPPPDVGGADDPGNDGTLDVDVRGVTLTRVDVSADRRSHDGTHEPIPLADDPVGAGHDGGPYRPDPAGLLAAPNVVAQGVGPLAVAGATAGLLAVLGGAAAVVLVLSRRL